jgi:hypothetical protein
MWLGACAVGPARDDGARMSDALLRLRPRLQVALPWIVLSLALVLATEPIWSIPLLGFSPAMDEFLLISRCFRPLQNSYLSLHQITDALGDIPVNELLLENLSVYEAGKHGS